MVLTRVFLMKRQGVKAMHFGEADKKDFLISPFAFFYFYTIFGACFGWPLVIESRFFEFEALSWMGIASCTFGLTLMLWSLTSFGKSFRVGIDNDRPDKLITTGIFTVSRNPIYVAFAFVLLGEFLIFPNWILLAYVAGGFWLFHRQVLLEENALKKIYGEEYAHYCQRVRRYL
jgi:protein-S-isoprenylcysteine O-methyltransferase Ste14